MTEFKKKKRGFRKNPCSKRRAGTRPHDPVFVRQICVLLRRRRAGYVKGKGSGELHQPLASIYSSISGGPERSNRGLENKGKESGRGADLRIVPRVE